MPGHDPGPPAPDEYHAYYEKYVSLVPRGPVTDRLGAGVGETLDPLRGLSDDEARSRQAPSTWSFKEVVGHLIDTERILSYRAVRVARGDATPLPGFEQDDYVRAARFDDPPLADLLAEFQAVRAATVWQFRNLDAPAWMRRGTADGKPVSVRALAHIIAGHERHHAAILRDRVARLRG